MAQILGLLLSIWEIQIEFPSDLHLSIATIWGLNQHRGDQFTSLHPNYTIYIYFENLQLSVMGKK